jgi:hypothetical protein
MCAHTTRCVGGGVSDVRRGLDGRLSLLLCMPYVCPQATTICVLILVVYVQLCRQWYRRTSQRAAQHACAWCSPCARSAPAPPPFSMESWQARIYGEKNFCTAFDRSRVFFFPPSSGILDWHFKMLDCSCVYSCVLVSCVYYSTRVYLLRVSTRCFVRCLSVLMLVVIAV